MKALVLGGGGAKGFSHIPLLECLTRAEARPDLLVGTSIGALVGAIWAHGTLNAFREEIFRTSPLRMLSMLDPRLLVRGAVLGGQRLERLLSRFLPAGLCFEDLPFPVAVVAVDLDACLPVCFHQGPLLPAVRASIGLPGLLPPVACGAWQLVDGGVLEPLPLRAARTLGARRIAAVTLIPPVAPGQHAGVFRQTRTFSRNDEKRPNIVGVLTRSLDLALGRLTADALAADPPELLIAPSVGRIAILDFHRVRDAWNAGRAVAADQGEALVGMFRKRKRRTE
jgi:NTE family protein